MFRKPRSETLKAGALTSRISRCSVCIRSRVVLNQQIPPSQISRHPYQQPSGSQYGQQGGAYRQGGYQYGQQGGSYQQGGSQYEQHGGSYQQGGSQYGQQGGYRKVSGGRYSSSEQSRNQGGYRGGQSGWSTYQSGERSSEAGRSQQGGTQFGSRTSRPQWQRSGSYPPFTESQASYGQGGQNLEGPRRGDQSSYNYKHLQGAPRRRIRPRPGGYSYNINRKEPVPA